MPQNSKLGTLLLLLIHIDSFLDSPRQVSTTVVSGHGIQYLVAGRHSKCKGWDGSYGHSSEKQVPVRALPVVHTVPPPHSPQTQPLLPGSGEDMVSTTHSEHTNMQCEGCQAVGTCTSASAGVDDMRVVWYHMMLAGSRWAQAGMPQSKPYHYRVNIGHGSG